MNIIQHTCGPEFSSAFEIEIACKDWIIDLYFLQQQLDVFTKIRAV